MVLVQRVTAEENFQPIPAALASAASAYRHACRAEAEQLKRMGQLNLAVEWTDEMRSTVLATRECVRNAEAARAALREEIQSVVRALRERGESPDAVARHAESMIQLLESAGSPDEASHRETEPVGGPTNHDCRDDPPRA